MLNNEISGAVSLNRTVHKARPKRLVFLSGFGVQAFSWTRKSLCACNKTSVIVINGPLDYHLTCEARLPEYRAAGCSTRTLLVVEPPLDLERDTPPHAHVTRILKCPGVVVIVASMTVPPGTIAAIAVSALAGGLIAMKVFTFWRAYNKQAEKLGTIVTLGPFDKKFGCASTLHFFVNMAPVRTSTMAFISTEARSSNISLFYVFTVPLVVTRCCFYEFGVSISKFPDV